MVNPTKMAEALRQIVMLIEAVADLLPGGTHRVGQQLAIVHAALDAINPDPPPEE